MQNICRHRRVDLTLHSIGNHKLINCRDSVPVKSRNCCPEKLPSVNGMEKTIDSIFEKTGSQSMHRKAHVQAVANGESIAQRIRTRVYGKSGAGQVTRSRTTVRRFTG